MLPPSQPPPDPPSQDFELEAWLRDQVAPAADAIKADPSRGLTPEQVRQELAIAREQRRSR